MPISNPGTVASGTIPSYPAPARDLDGSEPIAGWQDGAQRAIPASAVAALAVPSAAAAAKSYADQAKASADSIAATKAVLDASHFPDLAPNLFPEVLDFGPGECTIDPAGLLGDGPYTIHFPASLTVHKGPNAYTGAPVTPYDNDLTGRTSVRDGYLYCKYNPAVTTCVFYDAISNRYFSDNISGWLMRIGDPGHFYDKAILLAVVLDGRVISPVPFRNAGDGIGPNVAPWGADITKAPSRYGSTTVVPTIAGGTFAGLGLTSAVRGDTGRTTFVGGPISAKPGARVFVRTLLQSSEDDQFGGVGIRIYSSPTGNGGDAQVGDFPARLERRWSARERTFIVSFSMPAGGQSFQACTDMGPATSGTAQTAIAGIQVAVGDGPARWIRYDDFAASGAALPVDPGMILPDTIWLDPALPLPLHLASSVVDPERFDGYLATVTGAAPAGGVGYEATASGGGSLLLDPARIGSQLIVNVDRKAIPDHQRVRKVIAIRKATGNTPVVHLPVTDSKGAYGLVALLAAKAAARGKTYRSIGAANKVDGTNYDECHPGWCYTDITHERTTYGAFAPGDRGQGRYDATHNALLMPDDGTYDAGISQNGYAVDFAAYQRDFVLPTPTHLSLILGNNDCGHYGDSDAIVLAQITRSLGILYHQARKAWGGGLKIGLAAWATGYPALAAQDNLYRRLHDLSFAAHYDFVRARRAEGDANIDYIAMYLHESRRGDYPPKVLSTDSRGVDTVVADNSLHEGDAGGTKGNGAEALYAWLYS